MTPHGLPVQGHSHFHTVACTPNRRFLCPTEPDATPGVSSIFAVVQAALPDAIPARQRHITMRVPPGLLAIWAGRDYRLTADFFQITRGPGRQDEARLLILKRNVKGRGEKTTL